MRYSALATFVPVSLCPCVNLCLEPVPLPAESPAWVVGIVYPADSRGLYFTKGMSPPKRARKPVQDTYIHYNVPSVVCYKVPTHPVPSACLKCSSYPLCAPPYWGSQLCYKVLVLWESRTGHMLRCSFFLSALCSHAGSQSYCNATDTRPG